MRDADGKLPAFVQHTLGLIKRAEVRNPGYQSIVSVQPMTQPVGGVAFYRPRYGTTHVASIGDNIYFKVDSVERLSWLLGQAAEDPTKRSGGEDWAVKKWLVGVSLTGDHCVEFRSNSFTVTDGLGQVQEEAGLGVEGLAHNEGYVDFLLSLKWRSAFGWPSETHVLGVAAHEGIEIYTETV
jgi:hypothetical protein